jgi:hypothetical protein
MGAEISAYSPSGVKFPDITFNISKARATNKSKAPYSLGAA